MSDQIHPSMFSFWQERNMLYFYTINDQTIKLMNLNPEMNQADKQLIDGLIEKLDHKNEDKITW